MEALTTIFEVQTFGPEQLELIRRAAIEMKVLPNALAEITSEDCDTILPQLQLADALRVIETWVSRALVSAEDIFRDPPEGCEYTGYGISCVVTMGELTLGPYLSYDWNDEEQRYTEHGLTLVRTSEGEYGLWGSSIASLVNWPESARLPEEEDDD